MNHHREFLVDLFRALGESGVRYCMLRNYDAPEDRRSYAYAYERVAQVSEAGAPGRG